MSDLTSWVHNFQHLPVWPCRIINLEYLIVGLGNRSHQILVTPKFIPQTEFWVTSGFSLLTKMRQFWPVKNFNEVPSTEPLNLKFCRFAIIGLLYSGKGALSGIYYNSFSNSIFASNCSKYGVQLMLSITWSEAIKTFTPDVDHPHLSVSLQHVPQPSSW